MDSVIGRYFVSGTARTPDSRKRTLLVGQNGPAYFLIPVLGEVATEDRELRRPMAKTTLQKNWQLTEASGSELGDGESEREIDQVETLRLRRKA